MTAAALAATSERGESRLVEWILVGGITPLLFVLSWIARKTFGLDASEYAIGFLTFYGAYVINDPHFTVTYLLFYRAHVFRTQRTRFVIAGVVVPIVLATWAIVSIRSGSAQMLGWMVQLMYLLVGWHYVKQGFGVLAVLSARRGVKLPSRLRTAALVHCFSGWAFAWANPSVPAGEYEEKGVIYSALAHPRWLELATGAFLAITTIALVAIAIIERQRTKHVVDLLAIMLFTIWSWTIFSSFDPLVRYAIPALHSLQYFYFVWLVNRNRARAHEGPPNFGRPVAVVLGILALSAVGLGWLLFHGVPTFLDETRIHTDSDLGMTPWLAAFFVFLNVHHYFMDAVVWRRENPETRWLVA